MSYIFGQASKNLQGISLGTPQGPTRPNLGQLQQEASQAEAEAQRLGSFRGQATQVGKELGSFAIGAVPRFLASAAAAPIDIARTAMGKEPMQGTFNIPGQGPQQTFQAGATKRFGELAQGQGSNLGAQFSMAGELAKTPLAAAETFGAYKGLTQGVPKLAEKGIEATKRLFDKSAQKNALEVILPTKMRPKELEKRLGQSDVEYKGFITKTAVPKANKYEKEIANAVKDIVNPKFTPDKNINLLKKQISTISQNQVVPNLRANPQAFNTATLAKKLNEIKTPVLLKGDTTLANAYNNTRKVAIELVSENKHTMEGLWEARKKLDSLAEEANLLDFESQKVSAKAVRDVRNAINNFIIDSIPNGQKLYGDLMKQMSQFYRAIDMIKHNAPKEIIRHPLLKKGIQTAKWAVPVGGAGYGIGYGINRFIQ